MTTRLDLSTPTARPELAGLRSGLGPSRVQVVVGIHLGGEAEEPDEIVVDDEDLDQDEAAPPDEAAPRARALFQRPLVSWEDLADRGRPAERPQWHLRPDLVPPPSDFRILVDTREQAPLFVGRPWAVRATLATGDYSLAGYEGQVVLERKSLADAYGTIGRGRERFERELERMRPFACKGILVEATYADLLDPERQDPCWRSRVHPASVEGSLLAFRRRFGVEVLFAGNRLHSERLAFRWLATWWLEAQEQGLPRTDWEGGL